MLVPTARVREPVGTPERERMLQHRILELLLAAEAPAAEAPAATPPAPAGGAGGAAGGGGDMFRLLLPLVAVFFIFWLLVFRPESRKRKEREKMISAVKKGDSVVTTGGLIGKVWKVEGTEITVIVDRDVKARFLKSSVIEVIRGDSEEGGSKEGASQG